MLGLKAVRLADQPAVPGDAGLQVGLCAEYSQTIRPPQQKPVMPSLATSPLPVPLAQATVASRSDITWASGTLETTLEMISGISLIFETSPCRA